MCWTWWAYTIWGLAFITWHLYSNCCFHYTHLSIFGSSSVHMGMNRWGYQYKWKMLHLCWHWIWIDVIWGLLSLYSILGAAWKSSFTTVASESVACLSPLIFYNPLCNFSFLCGIQNRWTKREVQQCISLDFYPKYLFIILLWRYLFLELLLFIEGSHCGQ